MPVSMKLYDLLKLDKARHLWPDQFAAFVAALEEEPTDKTALGPMADWLTEQEESELAAAARYVFRRQEVAMERKEYTYHRPDGRKTNHYWEVTGDPHRVTMQDAEGPTDTPAGALARLAHQLAEARKELE